MLASVLLGILLLGHVSLAGSAWAESVDPTASPSPVVEEPASASPSPSVAPSPVPSVSPEPTASVSPSPSPSVVPSAAPEPSSQPKEQVNTTETDNCGGVMPRWVFDTAAQKWIAADQGSFICDKASGYYLSPKYMYDKRSGRYLLMPPSPEPTPDYLLTTPDIIHTVLGDLVVGSQDYEVARTLGLIGGSDSIAISGTGTGSNNAGTVSNSGQTWLDLTNLVNVINTLQSNATTGNVTAANNTQIGGAITGAASVVANIFNLLASAWSWSNGNLSFFTQTLCDFDKTCTGNVNLNPIENMSGGGGQLGGATLDNTGADSTNVAKANNTTSLDINAKNSGNIVNNVDVSARSGDVSATSNSSVGNIASGNALAEVNILNFINSFISSGSSFFGILNIFGQLHGNILFPNGFLNGLVPSDGSSAALTGTGPGSSNQASIGNSGHTTVNNASYNGVDNIIQTMAESGSATAGQNSRVGSVPQSGSANTTQGLFNLSNNSIFGDNAVLVIVNVLGHWVGKIMTLPGGSTSSALLTGNAQVGSNITGPNSYNQTAVSNSENANVNQESVGTITNNVNVDARSGDASAVKNTSVGSVTTGDAKAATSVANIFNTIMSVKHWFGVLVINVFGDWTGGVDTGLVAGSNAAAVVTAPKESESIPDQPSITAPVAGGLPQQSHGLAASVSGAAVGAVAAGGSVSGPKVLTAAAHQPSPVKLAVAAKGRDVSILFGLSALMMLTAGVLASMEKKLKRR